MALEAVVYPQDPFNCKEFYSLGGASLGYDYNLQGEDKSLLGILETKNNNNQNQHQLLVDHLQGSVITPNWEYYSSSSPNTSGMRQVKDQYWDPTISSPEEASTIVDHQQIPFPGSMVLSREVMDLEPQPQEAGGAAVGRRKRRRTKSTKNKEEIENQRMTHIAVERNRRKQMNEYLTALRSLMPSSYVQRGDQASIIGGAINYVKKLEQLLQNMEANKKSNQHQEDHNDPNGMASSPFADFFTFPQYSTRATQPVDKPMAEENQCTAVAEIEVTMVESHANLKILSKKRPRQLLKLVAGLQSLRLTILHLNVTTVDAMVFYSVSVKVEEGCLLNSVDEIAAAVNQMIHKIEEEAALS